ncbi:hypothetical protein SeMB42_g06338 [Synchytrium endobioticum]|uniref:Uncharacterized protein n=1 Tax=Synchytrium endobioticum TaxID=286115 RepID=A0A507CLJ7_9FUNG|nr:hypothetical protein SeMB42_g06338 [Synchytrium endobioticum]TPX43906.1 hypothetical protein SeLEV6574_g04813 [Synchytrium endobioticum]
MEGPFATAFRASKFASLSPFHYRKQILTAPQSHRVKGDFGLKHSNPITPRINNIPPIKTMIDVDTHYASIITSLKSQYIRVHTMDTPDGHPDYRSGYKAVSRLERWKELFPTQTVPEPVYARLNKKDLHELDADAWLELVKKAKKAQRQFRTERPWIRLSYNTNIMMHGVRDKTISRFDDLEEWQVHLGLKDIDSNKTSKSKFGFLGFNSRLSASSSTPAIHQPTYAGPKQQQQLQTEEQSSSSILSGLIWSKSANIISSVDDKIDPILIVPGRRMNPATLSRQPKERYGTKEIKDAVAVGGFVAGLVDSDFVGDTVLHKSDHGNVITRYKVVQAQYDDDGNPYIVLSRDWRHNKRSLNVATSPF